MTTHTSQPQVTTDVRNWATLSHLSGFALFLGIPPAVGPLVMWLLRRDEPYAEYHAKEALNFQISFMIYAAIAAISIIALVGILLLPAVAITWLVLDHQGRPTCIRRRVLPVSDDDAIRELERSLPRSKPDPRRTHRRWGSARRLAGVSLLAGVVARTP